MADGRAVHLKILHRSRLFRESLAEVLAHQAGYAAEAVDHRSAGWQAAFESPSPDVVLIDLKLPRNLAVKAVQEIRSNGIDAKVLLLVTTNDWRHLEECVELGVHGCVLGDSSLEHLVEAIDRAVQGDMFCSPEILEILAQRLLRRRSKPLWVGKAAEIPLSAHEKEVLELIMQGLRDQQIAQRLGISLYGVKRCIRGMLDKVHEEMQKPAESDGSGERVA